MKTLHCSDLGFQCDAVVKARTEEEILTIAARHAEEVHGVKVNREMIPAIKAKIKDEASVSS